jgi:dTDP-glucose 4,6-dehydratase
MSLINKKKIYIISNMKNLLITGGLGFIASNFVNYMSIKYPHIKLIILDKKDYCSSIDNIKKESLHNTEIIIGDIQNNELVSYILTKFNIDTIFHFAAQSHVDNSFYNSIEFTKNNVLGTHVLLETARLYHEKTNNLEKFIHISTDEVYGEVSDNLARTETSTLNPTNPYAASKLAAENFVRSYHHSYKLPIIITRGNNVYGINQYPEKVIPKFICSLLNGQKLTIQGSGSAQRNFIHVNDTCSAFETILLKGEIGQIYNISSNHDNEYTVFDLAKILIKLFHPDCDIDNKDDLSNYLTFIEDRKFNDCRYFICNQKLENMHWKPVKTDFINNLGELIDWYRINKGRYGF